MFSIMVTMTVTQHSVNAIFQDNPDKPLPEYLSIMDTTGTKDDGGGG